VKAKVLIVDDDKSLAGRVADLLEFEGYEVSTALNGREGLTMLQRVGPELIILDMNMPGMGGIGFLREFHAMDMDNAPAVIIFTARVNMGDFFDGMEVAGYLTKPCDPDVLLRTVADALTARSLMAKPLEQVSSPRVVLLAEDDALAADRIASALKTAGWKVVTTSSGPEALEMAIAHKPVAILAKMILTGMNGDRLAQTAGHIPSLAGTSFVLYDDTGVERTKEDIMSRGPTIKAVVRSSRAAEIVAALEQLGN
jgi:DNA-binding response OmpR family regulator